MGGGLLAFVIGAALAGHAEDELLIFAVVSEVPKDKSRVAVKASVNDVATDTKLLASDAILNNLIWKKLEICHAMRVEGTKAPDGYRVVHGPDYRCEHASHVAAVVCGRLLDQEGDRSGTAR